MGGFASLLEARAIAVNYTPIQIASDAAAAWREQSYLRFFMKQTELGEPGMICSASLDRSCFFYTDRLMH